MKIRDDIKYIGVNDHEVDLFEGQYVVPRGMAYNSYLIDDEKKVVLEKDAALALCGDRIAIRGEKNSYEFLFDETAAVTVLGKNKANIYHGGRIYQIKSGKRFNALKYVHIYNRYKNITKGDANAEFLGL